jgi:hypothetical protein
VEVKNLRETYRIPETEMTVLAAEYTERGTGAELAARATAMHKYSAQTAKEPLSAADATLHDLQDSLGHAEPRTTRRYDRSRHKLAKPAGFEVARALVA